MPVGKHLTDQHPGSWWVQPTREAFMAEAKRQAERFLRQRSHSAVSPDFHTSGRITNRWTDAKRKQRGG
jgi:hypothetical protein